MASVLGLSSYRWNNNFKSVLLLLCLPGLLLVLLAGVFYAYGSVLAYKTGYIDPHAFALFGLNAQALITYDIPQTPYAFAYFAVQKFWLYVLGIAGLWVTIGYLFNNAIIHAATGARRIERQDAPDLYNLLENLCISRGMKMPALYVVETSALNAYASGLDDSSYAVTVTRGLLETLNDKELEAVLGHELTHIINRDCRLLIITIVFAGMLSFMAQMLWRNMYYISNSRARENKNSGQATLILMLISGVALVLGYGLAVVLRFALSRRREYLADAGSVELTKNPEALISALRKIAGHCEVPHVPSEVKQMFIENPPSIFDMGGLFATHPPIEARIQVLQQLAGEALPARPAGSSIIPPSA